MIARLSALRARSKSVRPGRFDSAVAVVLAVSQLLILGKFWGVATAARPGVLALGVAVALATTLPLAFRRRAPFAVFAAVAAATFAYIMLPLLTQGESPALPAMRPPAVRILLAGPPLGPLVVLYSVAAYASRGRSWTAAAVSAGWIGVLYVVTEAADFVLFATAVLVACWVSGRLARTRALYVAELERDREARARLAVAQERGRIARDLHDVVAHAVTVVHVQTRAARGALQSDVPAVDRALEVVEQTAGQALSEMRRLLGALRDDTESRRAPQPRITDLGPLVDRYRGAGLPVRMEQPGGPQPLPAALEVAVYRLVQESLTNVLKHASPQEVVVRVRYDDAQVHVEVANDGTVGSGTPPPGPDGGLGLAGMRERVGLLGGQLIAGPTPYGRFRVRATLPVNDPVRPAVRERA